MREFRVLFPVLFFLFSCAKIVAPSGGPVDKTPPSVISVFPEPGFVLEMPDEITLLFSEKILASDETVQLYPRQGGEIRVNGREVGISTGMDNGIVMVTVSSTLEDLRGNRIENPETFVWNSIPADSFAEASISLLRDGGGTVTSSARSDFFLLPDTTSPAITHYPDTMGVVFAGWLTAGDYRIVCYEDIDQSRDWDPEREPGSLRVLTLNPGASEELQMTMTIIDSIGPRISDVVVLDSWHLDFYWNEQISVNMEDWQKVTVTGPDSLPVRVYGASSSQGRSANGRMTVYTEQMSDTLYSVAVAGIQDLAGNPSLADTLVFWGTDSLPSEKLTVRSAYPPDGDTGVPSSGPFYISFSDWVDESAIQNLYTVTRVADSTNVPGEFLRMTATGFSFTPDRELLGERQYRIDLLPGYVSLQGDSLEGSRWTFKPMWSDLPGKISGIISGTGAPVVTMVVAPAGSGGEVLTAEFAPGEYLFSDVFGGRYTVSVFVDWNSDNVWNPGEPYGAWPGVVEVFPGIETELIDIQVVP